MRLDPEETKKQKLRKKKELKGKKPVIDYFESSASSSTPRKRLNPNPLRKIKVQKHRAGKICVQKMEKMANGIRKLNSPGDIHRELVLKSTCNLIDHALVPSTLETFSKSLANDYQNFLGIISPAKPKEKYLRKEDSFSKNGKSPTKKLKTMTDGPIGIPIFSQVPIFLNTSRICQLG